MVNKKKASTLASTLMTQMKMIYIRVVLVSLTVGGILGHGSISV